MAFPSPALRSTMQPGQRAQIAPNSRLGPAYMPQGLSEAIPSIRLALAPPIEPLEQHPTRQMQGQRTALCVVRDGIIVQRTLHPRLGLPQQGARRQPMTASAEPIRPPSQCLPQFLPRSLALAREDTLTGGATKEGQPQAREVLGFFSAPVGIGPGLSSACKLPRFLLRQLQRALPQALTETCTKARGIRLVLATRPDIIGKPEPIRFAPTLTTPPTLAPAIQDLMEGDMRKERREQRAVGRPDLCGLHESIFPDSGLSPPADQAPDALVSTPRPEKLPPPLVVHRVAKAADVGLYEVAHPLLLERPSQHIQALVRPPLG